MVAVAGASAFEVASIDACALSTTTASDDDACVSGAFASVLGASVAAGCVSDASVGCVNDDVGASEVAGASAGRVGCASDDDADAASCSDGAGTSAAGVACDERTVSVVPETDVRLQCEWGEDDEL